MTDATIQALIDAAKTASPGDLVTWAELKAVLEGLKGQVSLTDLGTPVDGKIAKVISGAWALGDDNAAVSADDLWTQSGDTVTPNSGRSIYFTNSADTEVFEILQPSNYGSTYGTYTGQPTGVAERFYRGWAMNPSANSSGRPDVVGTMWSYNHNMGGGRINSSEAAFGFRTETHYETGGQQLFEFHMPAFTGTDGVEHRLFSWYIPKSGIAGAGGPRIETDLMAWYPWGDQNAAYASIGESGVFEIYTAVDGSQFPQIRFGSQIATVNGVTSSLWNVRLQSQGNTFLIGHDDTSYSQANPSVCLKTMDNFHVGTVPGYSGVLADQRGFYLGGYQQIFTKMSEYAALRVIHDNRNEIASFGWSESEYSLIVYKEAVYIRSGTTANRPTGGSLGAGMMRFNSTTSKFEGYTGSAWVDFH